MKKKSETGYTGDKEVKSVELVLRNCDGAPAMVVLVGYCVVLLPSDLELCVVSSPIRSAPVDKILPILLYSKIRSSFLT